MSKLKSHRASRKRFKVTATGKVLRRRPGARHLMSGKSGKSKRQLRRTLKVAPGFVPMIRQMLEGK